MHGIDWDDIRYFLEVVRSDSMSQAAKQLGVNHTTVSRRLAALEEQLGKKLFDRENGWAISPVGERLVNYAESMAEEANNIARQVLADSHELSGLLRVTSADPCVDLMMMPTIKKFISAYPEVELEVIDTAEEVDLSSREADVALRGTDNPPPNLVGKRIATINYTVYGNEELKQRFEAEPQAHDIPCVTWIGDGHTLPIWIDKDMPHTRRVYRASSITAMLAMAREGLGLAQLPCMIADVDPLLHRINTMPQVAGWGLWVLSHVDLRTTARVRIFRDFLVDELMKKKDLIEGNLAKTA